MFSDQRCFAYPSGYTYVVQRPPTMCERQLRDCGFETDLTRGIPVSAGPLATTSRNPDRSACCKYKRQFGREKVLETKSTVVCTGFRVFMSMRDQGDRRSKRSDSNVRAVDVWMTSVKRTRSRLACARTASDDRPDLDSIRNCGTAGNGVRNAPVPSMRYVCRAIIIQENKICNPRLKRAKIKKV